MPASEASECGGAGLMILAGDEAMPAMDACRPRGVEPQRRQGPNPTPQVPRTLADSHDASENYSDLLLYWRHDYAWATRV